MSSAESHRRWTAACAWSDVSVNGGAWRWLAPGNDRRDSPWLALRGRLRGTAVKNGPLLVAFAAIVCMAGCLVIPHPRDIAVARGIERKKPKLEFLKDGATTKADVLRELGDFDTTASQGRFVWARWQQVKMQVEGFAASYPGGAAGGSTRVWVIKNVLAGFDDHEVLAEHRICSEHDLIDGIEAMRRYRNPSEVSTGLTLPSWRGKQSPRDGRAIFAEGQIAFEHFHQPARSFSVPFSSVSHMSEVYGASAEALHLCLHFKKGTKLTTLNLEASPEDTLRLLALLWPEPRQ